MTPEGASSEDSSGEDEAPSLADILTTASAVAHFLGSQAILAEHLATALAIQRGQMTMDELGKPLSPLVQRYPRGAGPGVAPAVQALVQRWFAELGTATAPLSEEQMERLRGELNALS